MVRQPPVERRSVQVGTARIAYGVIGGGPPVVLVHGLGGSGRWWGRNVAALAGRFRVHAVDLVGVGTRRGGLTEAGALLADWMTAVGIERAAVIGHSLGGRIVLDLAADTPARVDRLVLVAAAVFPNAALLPRAAGLVRSARATPPDFLPLLVGDAWRTGPATLWRTARALLAAGAGARPEAVAAPALLVWGERDAIVPPSVGQELARRLPRAELAIIPRAGHVPMWERPAEFNRLVVDFLSRPHPPESEPQ